MTSREPLPVCLAVLCFGIVIDKTLGVPSFFWGTLFFILVGVWVGYNRSTLRWGTLKSSATIPRHDEAIINRRLLRSTIVLLGLVTVVGGLWHHWYWNVYPPNDPGLFRLDKPTPVIMEGTVISSPRWIPPPPDVPGRLLPPSDHTIVTLRATRLRNGVQWEPAHGRVSVTVLGKLPDVRYGDSLQIIGKLSHPNRPQNPGDYDQATILRQQRILSVLRVDGADSVTKLKSGSWSVARLLERVRAGCRVNISQYMETKHANFAAAMILGMREEIDPELSQIMLESGAAHIIAISGLHVGLFSLGFIVVLRFLGLRRKTFAILLAAMILCYLCLTDMRPSAIRASLLVFVACLSIFRGQRRLQINAFAATGIVVLILNPTNMFQVGAQLSFLATSVFLWFDKNLDLFGNLFKRESRIAISTTEEKEKALNETTVVETLLAERQPIRLLSGLVRVLLFITLRWCRKLINSTINTLRVSTSIWLVVSPIIATQMHVFPLVALLINPLLWVPLSLALLSGFGVMVTGWFCPPLAYVLGLFANGCYAFLTGMFAWFHAMPHSFFWVPGFSGWWLAGLYAPYLFLSIFPQLRPKKRWLAVAASGWLLVALAVPHVRHWNDWYNDRLYVRVLSVGHGLCVHIKTPNGKSILYDAGSLSSPYKSTTIAANSLWSFAHRKIDSVIISHPDSDHYNGLPMLLEKFPAEAAYVTPFMFQKEGSAIDAVHNALTSRNIPITMLAAGNVIDRPGFPTMTVLHPPVPDEQQLLLSTDSDDDVEQPGDIEMESLILLLNNTDSNINSLVLMVEHRGHRVLLPGDLESRLKPEFMRDSPTHVDVMLSPHHGSVKKTADDLVAWATPDFIVISGGLFTYNPNSKPHFEKSGCRVFETLKNGMVETVIDRHGIRVRSWR